MAEATLDVKLINPCARYLLMQSQVNEGRMGDLEVMYFKSVSEFINYLNGQISQLENSIKAVEANLKGLEARVKGYEALLAILRKLLGQENVISSPQIEVTGLKIIIDPKPVDEYQVLKESIDSMYDRLQVLKNVRELANLIASTAEVPILVQFRAGIPIRILIGVSA